MFRTRWTRLAIGLITLSLLAGSAAGSAQAATLIGRADAAGGHVLPWGRRRVSSSASANGRVPPFLRHQPVQGFSAVLRADDGGYLALPGQRLRRQGELCRLCLAVYRLTPDFATRSRGDREPSA